MKAQCRKVSKKLKQASLEREWCWRGHEVIGRTQKAFRALSREKT